MRLFRTTLFVLCFSLVATSASATWSVIAIDRQTGTIVVSSATCVPQRAFATFPANDLRDVQAIVVPGKGVAAAQARVDNTRANQKLIYAELQKGTPPEQILGMLKDDPRIEGRQFGIVDIEGIEQRVRAREIGDGAISRWLQRHGDGVRVRESANQRLVRGRERR